MARPDAGAFAPREASRSRFVHDRTVSSAARAIDRGFEGATTSAGAPFARAPTFPSTPQTDPSPLAPPFAAPSVGEAEFYGHMIAGALAGTTEHTAMFPLDTIKTRMQTATGAAARAAAVDASGAVGSAAAFASSSSANATAAAVHNHAAPIAAMRAAARGLMRAEGIAGLYRGVAAVGIGAGPAHAVYFATYEWAKRRLSADDGAHHPARHALAGAAATIVGDAVQTPVDTIKQRLQMCGSPYTGVWDCARRTVQSQGLGALYRSYPTTLAMNVPFTAMHFSAYESGKVFLGGDAVEEETFFTQFTAGGVAGGLAAAVTTPMDVVKTRMQTHCELAECEVAGSAKPETQPGSGRGVCAVTGDPVACKGAEGTGAAGTSGGGSGGVNARAGSNPGGARVAAATTGHPFGSANAIAVLRRIVAEEGVGALTRGIGPRVLFHIPAGAISWATYEAGKRMLGVSGGGHHHH
jgi:solute carrier family 25 iron transporter 28/37